MKRKLDMSPHAVAKREAAREAYKLNAEVKIEKVQAYKDANRLAVNAKGAAYMRERRATDTDPQFKLREQQRRLFYMVMQPGTKMNAARIMMCKWIGMPIGKLRMQLIEGSGYTWSEVGRTVVIDHIEPLVRFDLTDSTQCAIVWNHSNLRLLDRTMNQRKSGKERNNANP